MNWFLKIMMYAAVLYGVNSVLGGIHYSTIEAFMAVVIFLATVGHFADQWVLHRLGNVKSVLSGSVFMVLVVWGSQFLFPGSTVMLWAALVTGLILGVVEYFMHKEILATHPY